jgi:uncharacterized Tic20 family protein
MLTKNPSDEERILAALAHASIIANPANLLGLIAAALIWITQRQRSAYVAHHALHALVFQGVGLLLIMLMGLAWGGCLMVSLLPMVMRPSLYRAEYPLSFWLALLCGILLILGILTWIGYGILGAWAAWNGKPFTYGIVGRLIAKRMPETVPVADAAPGAKPSGTATDTNSRE